MQQASMRVRCFCRINYSNYNCIHVFEDDFSLVVFSNRQLSTNLAVAVIAIAIIVVVNDFVVITVTHTNYGMTFSERKLHYQIYDKDDNKHQVMLMLTFGRSTADSNDYRSVPCI